MMFEEVISAAAPPPMTFEEVMIQQGVAKLCKHSTNQQGG